jgi:hypothetical protein
MDAEAAKPDNACTACGSSNRAGARFCHACGVELAAKAGRTPAVVNEQVAPPSPAPAARAPASVPSSASASVSSRLGWLGATNPIVLAAAVIVVIAIGVSVYLLLAGHGQTAGEQYVSRMVRVRTSTDVAASSVLGDLRRGDAVSGVWVTAADGHTRWLKIKWASGAVGFVWGANLSPSAPPVLTTTVDADVVLAVNTSVFPQPSASGAALAVLPAGTKVREVGTVASGWREIERAEGGVGYLPPA